VLSNLLALLSLLFSFLLRPPPSSTLFPYTTLFRSTPSRPRWWRGAVHRPPSPRVRSRGCSRNRRSAARPSCSALRAGSSRAPSRSEEHTSELQSLRHLVCRLLLEKKKKKKY